MYSGFCGSVRAADTPSAAMGVYVPPAPAWSVLSTTDAEPLLVGAGALLSPPEPVAEAIEVEPANSIAATQMERSLRLIDRTTEVAGQLGPGSCLLHHQTKCR